MVVESEKLEMIYKYNAFKNVVNPKRMLGVMWNGTDKLPLSMVQAEKLYITFGIYPKELVNRKH